MTEPPETPASAEVVAYAVAEARAALSRIPRPPATPAASSTPTRSTPRPSPLDEGDALASLFAALRRLRGAVSEVEAALADAAPYLSSETGWTQEKAHTESPNTGTPTPNASPPNRLPLSPDTESRADDH